MAGEQGLQTSLSDHSSRRQGLDSTSSSNNSNKKTNKSSNSQRNSACTQYSEDFEDHSSAGESFKREDAKRKPQETKKRSVERSTNLSYQKRVQTKPRFKTVQKWNQSSFKIKSQKCAKLNTEEQVCDSITRHILSARLNKTKELKNEVYELQRELENARMENRLLRQLQYRHVKALVKFENEQNNLPRLLAQHESEVQMLKQMLRKSKEQDRCVSKQLKEAESELWKTKNTLQKLKAICDKKDLEERDELTCKLTELTKKLEIDEQKIQEKERRLEARNIYVNRISKSNASSPRYKVNVAKAIQTEECISPISSFSPRNVLPNLEKKTVHSEETLKDIDGEDSKASKRQLNKESEIDSEVVKLRKEYEQAERRWEEMVKRDILEHLEKEKREKQEKERIALFFKESFESKESEGQEETTLMKETDQQNAEKAGNESLLDDTKETDEAFTLTDSSNKTSSRHRRYYKFTEQTENLHQGLPVCKLSYVTQNNNKKQRERLESKELLDLDSSFISYEPSFGKFYSQVNELKQQVGDGPSERLEKYLPSSSRNDKKHSLIETLFQSGDTLENKPSKDIETKASEKLKQRQRSKQTSRIQVANKNRLNLLDPNLLHERVLESSTDESEKIVLQSLNK
ncbi:lebercilin-like protein isoform X2 [Narcine bancroftii]|uniref:lebercilin-like protein isoform X2 n=1 Tax=Narcine bancroftii TaxID=1343680 RepID=UPI00383190DB